MSFRGPSRYELSGAAPLLLPPLPLTSSTRRTGYARYWRRGRASRFQTALPCLRDPRAVRVTQFVPHLEQDQSARPLGPLPQGHTLASLVWAVSIDLLVASSTFRSYGLAEFSRLPGMRIDLPVLVAALRPVTSTARFCTRVVAFWWRPCGAGVSGCSSTSTLALGSDFGSAPPGAP